MKLFFSTASAWLRRFILVLVLLLGGSSSSSSAADLSGNWQGYWESESTGHRGPLRCTFTRIDAITYRADFSGRFFKVIPFHYSMTFSVAEEGDTTHLSGDHYLGRRYGTFYFDASATECEFVAEYSSCKDDGRFVLTRCCCE